MNIESQFEREEDQLHQDYADGLIDLKELNQSINRLNREYRECAREAAEDAYDREMGNW